MPEENPGVKRKPTLKKAGGKTEEEEGRRVFIESVLKKTHPGSAGTFKPDRSNRFHCGADIPGHIIGIDKYLIMTRPDLDALTGLLTLDISLATLSP